MQDTGEEQLPETQAELRVLRTLNFSMALHEGAPLLCLDTGHSKLVGSIGDLIT